MKSWGLTVVAALVVVGATLTACNKGGGSATGGVGIYAPGNPYGLNGQQIGFYAQTSNFTNTMFFNNGSSLTPMAGWKNMLQEAMGVCNRNYSDGGLSDCTAWMNGMHDIVIQLDGSSASSVKVTIRSYPQVNPYSNYYYSLPSPSQFFSALLGFPYITNPTGVFDPMILSGSIWTVNNNQGFEIRSLGPQVSYGWNKTLQLQVAFGKIEDNSFGFNLYWNGIQAASGTMVRCQSMNCGL